MTKEQLYFQKYWEKNRTTILKSRRDKYKFDPKIRETISERSRVRSKLKMFSEGEIKYSLNSIAKLSKISYWWLNERLKQGLLPKGPYTEEQLYQIIEEVKNVRKQKKK